MTDPEAPLVAIASGSRFEGLLSFWGEARVEGQLVGDVVARGALHVGPEGRVRGRVEVEVLVVEGLVEGEITALDRVEVLDGATVRASIRTPRLAVAEGATFEGRLHMTAPRAAAGGAASAAASAA